MENKKKEMARSIMIQKGSSSYNQWNGLSIFVQKLVQKLIKLHKRKVTFRKLKRKEKFESRKKKLKKKKLREKC